MNSPTLAKTRRRAGDPLPTCIVCHCETAKPRKGRCERCYMHLYRGLVPLYSCECCGLSDRRMLVRRRMVDSRTPRVLCGSDATLLGRRPIGLAELKAERGEAAAA